MGQSFNIGDFVEHDRFGRGTVVGFGDNSLTISFESGEERDLAPFSLRKLDQQSTESISLAPQKKDNESTDDVPF